MAQIDLLQNQEFKEAISKLISELLSSKLTEFILQREREAKEITLVERLLRVEEELKSMRELQAKQFEFLLREMNTRFEALQRDSNSKFEAIITRFEALQREMNTRFEALYTEMNTRFETLYTEMNTRFETLYTEINTRFAEINTRFEALEKRFNFFQWFVGAGFALLSILIALSKFF